MKSYTRTLILISRIVVGVVFIYSGFVKIVDPLGSTYKFIDYFNTFGANWATTLAFSLSLIQSIAEFVVGVAVLFNLKIRWSSLGALIFMAFYTPLTLYIAIYNPVHDCGCFGDAWVITNWQTFWKNVVLSVPVVFVFINRKKIESPLRSAEQWILSGIATIAICFIAWQSYNHTPLLDFRPYKTGTCIREKMERPEGAPADVWESTFIYKKNGEEKTFTAKNLPDSTWDFVDAKHVLIKKGYEPPIHDFSINNADGEDITDVILDSPDYNFLLIAYNLDKYNYKANDHINQLAAFCRDKGYPFYLLTSSTDEAINRFKNYSGAEYEICITDETTLKTIIRSNPGLLLLKDGVIIEKWHFNDIPPVKFFEGNILAKCIDTNYTKTVNFYLWVLTLTLAFVASIYLIGRRNFKQLCCKQN
jgi:uncharacterized membrane protein YphA (DoxX/SURF4 family)